MMPILLGSIFHSLAYARTIRTACCASYTASVCALYPSRRVDAEDDGVDSVVIKKRNEVGALASDVQCVVSAARDQNHRRARIQSAFDRVTSIEGL